MSTRIETSLSAQLERMEKARVARRERPVLRETHITLSHGAGGKASQTLIDALIVPTFADSALDGYADAAILAAQSGRLAFTTDSYVVSPLFFPGGDIGKLAVHGTINDLACAGARALYLSVGLILEEGLAVDTLTRVLQSMASAAQAAGVRVVTGDTKVVSRGHGDGIYVNTSGVGVVGDRELSPTNVRPGDVVLVTGFVGDHGMAVMLAREALDIDAAIESDSAALHGLAAAILGAAPDTRVLKDPTRGGVATSLNEIARRASVAIAVDEERVPVRDPVRGACEILGIDPLHIANEGKLLAIVPADQADAALAATRADALGRDAAIIGRVTEEPRGMVLARTGIGGSRVLDMLVGDPLPRIC
jgi:hydrogenase expression/formation protein HypE